MKRKRKLSKALLFLAAAGFLSAAGIAARPSLSARAEESTGAAAVQEETVTAEEGVDTTGTSKEQTLERTLSGISVCVSGDLPEDCALYVQDLSYAKSYADAVDQYLGSDTTFSADGILDIYVKSQDEIWQPYYNQETVTVSVNGISDPEDEEAFHIGEDGTVTKMESSMDAGTVRFTTDHFSVYAIGREKKIGTEETAEETAPAVTVTRKAVRKAVVQKASASEETTLEGTPYAVLTDKECTIEGVTYPENSLLFVRSQTKINLVYPDYYTVTRLDGSTVQGYVRKVDETTVNRTTSWGWTNDLPNITQIATLDTIRPHSTEDWFNTLDLSNGWKKECHATKIDLSKLDTSLVTNMTAMFEHCTDVTSLDLSGFDTSNVVNMDNVFNNCQSLEDLDISGWNTAKVKKMNGLFNTCIKLTSLDLSGFDTENVTTMEQMFWNCRGLTSLSMKGWNTANVTDMNGMFRRCDLLTDFRDVSKFDTSKVTNLSAMFSKCYAVKTLDLSNFDTSACSNMQNMFLNDTSLAYLNIGNFDMTGVTNTTDMFTGDTLLKTIVVADKLPSASAASTVAIPNTLYEKFDSGDYGTIAYTALPASPTTKDAADDGTMTITELPMFTITYLSPTGSKVLYTETVRHGADASALHTDYLWCTDREGKQKADLTKITKDMTVYGITPVVVPTGIGLPVLPYLVFMAAALAGAFASRRKESFPFFGKGKQSKGDQKE